MSEPNKERLRLWVKALRSGDYVQCKERLRWDGAFCCLGVACEVAVKNGLEIDLTSAYDDQGGQVLPAEVMDWLGLDERDPNIAEALDEDKGYFGPIPISATMANDDNDWTFGQIADAIEKQYGLTDA